MAESLAEALPREQARVRGIQRSAKEIGPAGAFLVAMTEASLRRADEAVMSGDVVAMARAYQDLAEFKE